MADIKLKIFAGFISMHYVFAVVQSKFQSDWVKNDHFCAPYWERKEENIKSLRDEHLEQLKSKRAG